MPFFIILVHAPTSCGLTEEKDSFYSDSHNLLQSVRQTDVFIVGDFHAQVNLPGLNERHSGGHFGVLSNGTDNGSRLIQLCIDHHLFLAYTNFSYER